MKVSVDHLKKAVDWIRVNSHDQIINLEIKDGHMIIRCSDKYQVVVDIKIFTEASREPRIIKEDTLP